MLSKAVMAMMLVVGVVCWGGVGAQTPSPCAMPMQFTARSSQYNHLDDQVNRFMVAYDAVNKRKALIEEQNIMTPGRQFREYLTLASEGVMYEINLTLKLCTKSSMRRPWRPYGIPSNATFEDEFYIGGPGEEVFAQEWSDRIPLRQRAYWIGVVSMKNCYPIREVLVADYRELNSTVTSHFYDVVQGIPDPNVFIPPSYCQRAPWVTRPSDMGPFA